jgi:hypothetical protein
MKASSYFLAHGRIKQALWLKVDSPALYAYLVIVLKFRIADLVS